MQRLVVQCHAVLLTSSHGHAYKNAIERTLLHNTVVDLTVVGGLALQAKAKAQGLKAFEALELQQASQDTLKAATEGDDVEVGKGVGKRN